jgi:hypothetical protein
LVENGCQ